MLFALQRGVRVRTQAPPFISQKGAHAVMHKGVMDVSENARGVHDLEGQRQPRHPLCYDNDPSAGSPTETLLRLLLPLNDQV
jgi:hypothetical protein